MSKKTETREERIHVIKNEVSSCAHVLNVSDSAVRVLMGLVDKSNLPDNAVLPRNIWYPSKTESLELFTNINQAQLSILVRKDVRSIRNAIRLLEERGYIVRVPHKAGEKMTTKINGSKILNDAADAWQEYNWST